MPKKKKKKSSDKDKKGKKKAGITEREAVFYEQQIHDNNLQLSRLRTRNECLESEYDELKGKLNQLEDDRADVIAHLKRILQQKIEEAHELGERLLAMEELRKQEQNLYKTTEDRMKQDYHNMETNLNAEVKLVAGKLNALEDWRNARAELTEKFDKQEREMAEQEKRHKKILYEAERSLIIGKAKMQREIEERLNDLSLKFQEATNIRIADATQRAIRENIALHLEFDNMLKTCGEFEERMVKFKKKEENARLRASLYENEAKIINNKVIEQNVIIETLAGEHITMAHDITNDRKFQVYTNNKSECLKLYHDKYDNIRKNCDKLKDNIEQVDNNRIIISNEIQSNQREIYRLNNILNTVKRLIIELTNKYKSTDGDNLTCDDNFKEKLSDIYSLLENINVSNEVSFV